MYVTFLHVMDSCPLTLSNQPNLVKKRGLTASGVNNFFLSTCLRFTTDMFIIHQHLFACLFRLLLLP